MLLLLVFALVMVVVNLTCFDGLREGAVRAGAPLVSILVPARNEALNIEACVRLCWRRIIRVELLVPTITPKMGRVRWCAVLA